MAESRKNASRKQRRRKRSVRWSRILLLVVIVALIAGAGVGAGMVASALRAMPHIHDVRPAPRVTSFVYDSAGEQIAPLHGPENRIIVEYSEIPDAVRQAFIAIEDHRFYEHFGLDLYRIIGAAWNNLTGGPIQGGSTITQQLARNAWPIGLEQTYERKIQEAILAVNLERAYTKDQILALYLNQIPLGHGAHGVQAAAHVYFGKDVWDLHLAEAAMLAGLTVGPNVYSPYRDMELARGRMSSVLSAMVREGFITEEQRRRAEAYRIELVGLSSANEANSPAAHFIDYVLSQLLDRYSPDMVYGGGLRVYTTLDMSIQEAAEDAVRNHLDENFPLGEFEKDLQVAIVVVDPFTGHIKAMIGGREHHSMLEHNRAWQSFRQPGSAFKPIAVYTPALEAGWTTASIIDDAPVEYELTTSRFVPRNYAESGWPLGAYRGLTTVREALRRSVNVPAVRTLMTVGVEAGYETAERLGITSLVPTGTRTDKGPALALGGLTTGVSPLELTLAYSTFAAGGIRPDPIAITRVVDRHGNVLEENQPARSVAVSPEIAYLMNDMLKSVVSDSRSGWISNWGTGWRAELSGGWPAAGKTGTTDDTIDLWWIGYTAEYAATVWLGFDQPESIPDILGVSMPSGLYPPLIWKDIMEAAHAGLEPSDFERPENIIERTICIKSGLLPGPDCPTQMQRREIFIRGTEPVQQCDVHVVREVCSQHPNLLFEHGCPERGHPVEKVFVDREVPQEPIIDERGRTLPQPWDAADAVPTQTCVQVHGALEEPEGLFLELTMSPGLLVPAILRAEEGKPVTLEITSSEGDHRLVIEGLGIDVDVPEGEFVRLTFTPNQAGIYQMYCGEHYPDVRGEQGRFVVQR